MGMQKKPIIRASDAELRAHAEEVLCLDVSAATTRAAILGILGPAWSNDWILVEEAELEAPAEAQDETTRAQAQQSLVTGSSRDDPMWLIRVQATELPGGRDPVPVGVNGSIVVIQRGVEAKVPHRFVGALRDAVRESITQSMKTQEITRSTFTNYPFEIIERPSPQEIAEFRERTKDNVLA